MKTRRLLIPLAIAAVIAAVAVVVYVTVNPVDSTLEFRARDAVSRNWVWDATFRLQGRVIRSYYQSDQGPTTQAFTHVEPGETTLEILAPCYVTQTIPLSLKRGANRLEEPIDLVGYEIPDLTRWIIFDERVGNDVVQELRPVGSGGAAVLNHPCLDLWIGARICVQVSGGLPDREETEEGSERGEELFRGVLDWQWDPQPETTFRYSASIPGSKIKLNADPYWVIDYLIIVPDPRKITPQEVDQIMEKAWLLSSEEMEDCLEPQRTEGKLATYLLTSWNVQGARS